ncbi:MAG: enoyl-CoA hydratase [Desulfobacterales bacterium]
MSEAVLFEERGPVGWLTLNRPENRNALSLEVMTVMQEKLRWIAGKADIRVLIVRGKGPAFCAGHNLREISESSTDIHQIRKIFTVCTEMMESLHKMPQTVIAQVHGIATAAGCQLVAACDLAIAESGAQFAVPGAKIGLFCSTPMVPLCRAVGRKRALEMLLSGRFVSAQEAERFGLINRITEAETLEEETEKWAAELSQASGFTLAYGKQVFYRQIDLDESGAYQYAKEAIAINCLAEDAREGILAFLEKRPPEWKGR